VEEDGRGGDDVVLGGWAGRVLFLYRMDGVSWFGGVGIGFGAEAMDGWMDTRARFVGFGGVSFWIPKLTAISLVN
jgi:hypothetical protein